MLGNHQQSLTKKSNLKNVQLRAFNSKCNLKITPPLSVQYLHKRRKLQAEPDVKQDRGSSCSRNNIPAYKMLYRLVLSSQEGGCEERAAHYSFGTKTGEDERVKRTEAMVSPREGNLSKHNSEFSAHYICRMYPFEQISFYLCIL